MVREAHQPNLGQQLLFEAATEDLGKANATSVDIENGLTSLAQLRSLSLQQSMAILNLARNNMDSWVQASSPLQVLEAVTPPLTAYKQHAEQSNDSQLREDYTEASSIILSSVIAADPEAYEEGVIDRLKEGVFGEHGPVLAGVIKKLSDKMEQEGTIYRQRSEEADYSTLIGLLDELTSLKDPSLVEAVKPAIPAKLLYMDQARRMKLNPEVNKLLEDARVGNDPETRRLVNLYLTSEYDDQDELRERILEGEFGEAATVVDKIVSSIVEKDSDAAYELWLDMLDKNPDNPKLRPVTVNVLELNQYWQGEEAVYTCVASLNRLGLRIGQEELFVMKYGDRILSTLKANLFGDPYDSERFSEVEKQERLTEEQQIRIARFLRELRCNERESGEKLHSSIKDNLLSTVL